MWITKKDETLYWHVVIDRKGDKYDLHRKKGEKKIDLTSYTVSYTHLYDLKDSNRCKGPLRTSNAHRLAGSLPPDSGANGSSLYLIAFDLLLDHESPVQAPVQLVR